MSTTTETETTSDCLDCGHAERWHGLYADCDEFDLSCGHPGCGCGSYSGPLDRE